MTRLETVARAIYEKRMSQVGIPGFVIIPFDKLPRHARMAADRQATNLLTMWPEVGADTIRFLSSESLVQFLQTSEEIATAYALHAPDQIMGRRG